MEISNADQMRIRNYNLEQANLQRKRDDDYRKLIEKRNLDRIAEEQTARNIRLDLDKGRNIDVEC